MKNLVSKSGFTFAARVITIASISYCLIVFIRPVAEKLFGHSFRPTSSQNSLLKEITYSQERDVIDRTGKVVLQVKEFIDGPYCEGVAPFYVKEKNLFGYMDKSGKVVIKPRYFYARSFSCGRAIVWLAHNHFAIIDHSGKQIKTFFPGELNSIDDFVNDFAHVTLNGEYKQGLVDKDGKFVVYPKFSCVSNIHEGLAAASLTAKAFGPSTKGWGYIDSSGAWKIPSHLGDCGDFAEGLAIVIENGQYGFIDKLGNWRIKPRFEEAKKFSGGFAPIRIGSKWGFIDTSGNVIVSPQFDYIIEGFNNGLAPCALNSNKIKNPRIKFELQDSCDRKVLTVDPRYLEEEYPLKVGDFLRPKLKFGLVDQAGRWVVPPKYDTIQPFKNGMRMVEQNDKFGFLDASGREVVTPKYADARHFSDDVAVASMGQIHHTDRVGDFDPDYFPTSRDEIISQTPSGLIEYVYLKQALETCMQVAKLYPNNATIYSDMGWFNYALNRDREALKCYNKALAIKPKYIDLYSRRGELFLRMRRWKEAEQDCEKSLQLSREVFPGSLNEHKVRHLLGFAQLGAGKLKEAERNLSGFGLTSNENFYIDIGLNWKHPFQKELLKLCKLKGEKKFERALFQIYLSSERGQVDNLVLEYPVSERELLSTERASEARLVDILSDEKSTRLDKEETLAFAIYTKRKLIELLEGDCRVKETQILQERQLQLFEELKKMNQNFNVLRESNILVLNLADSYARENDDRCLALYRRLYEDKDAIGYQDIAVFNCALYKYLHGDKSMAKKIGITDKLPIYSLPTPSVEKLMRLEKKPLFEPKESGFVADSFLKGFGDKLIAPMPKGSETCSEYFALARQSMALGFETSARHFCEEALKSANPNLRAEIVSYMKTRLSLKPVSTKSMVKYLYSRQLIPQYAAGQTMKVNNRRISEEPTYLAPYVDSARALRSVARYDEAADYLNMVLKQNPNYLMAHEEKKILDSEMSMLSVK